MNINQGALYFGAGIDLNQWKRDVDSMRRDISGLSQNVASEAQKIDSSFKNLSLGIAGYFSAGALKNFAMELINVRGEFQKTEIAFSTMLRSTDKAKVLMGQMVDLAAKTPFSLQDVSAGAKQLLAFQIPANQVVDILTRMGNIAAGLGVPLSRINLVYGQVKAKGKLMGDDLRQFTEAGIPMVAELAKKFGKTTGKIQSMVSAGKIGFKDVQEVLFNLTNEGGMFYNLMEKQSASVSGQIANLGDSWDQMLNKIGQSNEGLIYSGTAGLTDLVEHYQELFEIIKTIVISYGSYKAAIIVTAAAQSLVNKTLATEIGLLGVSQRWKLGRALVTQKQTAATVLEAQAERASLSTKYATLQAEISSLAVKKQKAVALAIEKAQALGSARVQLSLAQAELRAVTANGTAREILIATKNVEKAQNTVIAAQESAEITRKSALAVGTQFYTTQKQLETTATALSSAATAVNTAEQLANAAAKDANAIATQRLTIAQLAQVTAMTAASKAAAFLNATLFANPYALAAALIAALTYAIYKYATALTVAEESQKRMDEDRRSQIPSITEQESKIKALTKVIQDQTSSEDKKASAMKQIKSITNGRLAQLDEEAIKTGKATDMIKKYIEMLKLEAEAKRYVNELGRLDADIDNLKSNRNKFGVGDVWDDFTDFDSDFKWNLKDRKKQRVDKAVKEKEEEKLAVQKRLNELAKRGVNISETEIAEETKAGKAGWAKRIKDQIEALEAEADNAQTKQAYFRIQSKIKKLQDLLNPPKDKERQLAEILPIGSASELQRRASLIQEAIDTAVNGIVKLRKLDKYGRDKDKNGNPFLTGETITSEEAGKRLEEINDEIKRRQYKNFDEQIAESERVWKAKYDIAKYYGNEIANEQFPELKGSYYNDISKRFEELNLKRSEGVKLKDSELIQWQKLKDILSSLRGEKDPLSNFNDSMERALQKLPSLYDQIEYLQKLRESQGETGASQGFYAAADAKLQEKIQEQKNVYLQFLKDQETFEQKKNQIEQKYDDIRKQIGENRKLTEEQRLKLLTQVTKKEGEEISSVAFEAFKKTDLWVRAFGDLERIGPKTLIKLKNSLEQYLKTDGSNLKAEELKTTQDQIKKINDLLSSNNPFIALGVAINNYKQKKKELSEIDKKGGQNIDAYNIKLEETEQSFLSVVEVTGIAANAMINIFSSVGDAVGNMNQGMKDDIAEVQNLVNGVVNTITGYMKKNYTQMASGILQMVNSLSKMLNGDDDKSFSIKTWERSVNDLKSAYEKLNREIAKTAGSEQFEKQRRLVMNLEQQKQSVEQMLKLESDKKKPNADKINEYKNQIADINGQIEDLVDGIIQSIAGTNFKDLATQLSDALTDAFGKGEDAVLSFDKVVDDVMRNAVKNALKIAILEPATKNIVDNLVKSLGYGSVSSGNISKEIADAENLLNSYISERSNLVNTGNQYSYRAIELVQLIKDLKAKIDLLKTQENTSQLGGAFDGLTAEEREKIKQQGQDAMNQYMAALKQYEDLFGAASENAQGLKGDIKGITEKTAGALEGQFNAVRINIVEIVKMMQGNQLVSKNQTLLLSQIEFNTRKLHNIDKNIKELNDKTKGKLAGVP